MIMYENWDKQKLELQKNIVESQVKIAKERLQILELELGEIKKELLERDLYGR